MNLVSNDQAAHAEAHGDASYVKIWAILLVLLVVSVAGPELEIPVLTLITAFGVAIVKAYLVARHFMHLNVEPKFVGYALGTCLGFVLLFYAGTAPDVMRHDGQNWVNQAAQEEVRRGSAAALPGLPGPAEPLAPEVAYKQTCAPCHGGAGAGDGAAAAALDPKPANFALAEFWETRDTVHVAKVIREGGASVGKSATMPAFGAQFDEEAAAALAEFIRRDFGPEELEADAEGPGANAEEPEAQAQEPEAHAEEPEAEPAPAEPSMP